MHWSRAAILALASVTGAATGGCGHDAPASSPVVREIVGGPDHACAIYQDGTVACWPLPTRAAEGSPLPARTPGSELLVPGIASAVAVSLGPLHGCALDSQGNVDCWSYSDRELSRPFHAVRVDVIPPMAQLEPRSSDARTCGVDRAHALPQCWYNGARRDWFGDPTMGYYPTAPRLPRGVQE